MTIMVLTKGCDHIHTQTVPHPDFFRHTVFLSVRVDDLVTTKIPPPPRPMWWGGGRGGVRIGEYSIFQVFGEAYLFLMKRYLFLKYS